ncbi:MAG TPA: hypothetical protein PKY35_10395 [Candidatus Hydrogenedentes bacterium]|nr:hypothetical protein [Candidatus Hydrogenedentota bacterium]HOL77430.1 hypothetical protein [Candidatus Hydrogenedentota bacterium]HPO84573.1 hypothetical protein [Candidatus Hydrogenedentota bacterium]
MKSFPKKVWVSLVVFLVGLTLVLSGCGQGSSPSANWKAKAPSNPGTAEQLAGTIWVVGGENTVAFDKDGSFKMGAGGAVMPVPGAKWTIENGIVTATANDRTLLTATFDGQTLIVNGVAATRFEPGGGQSKQQ